MATKIQLKTNRIIFDGHADNLEDCRLITALCDSLSTSENFQTVKYENGYAEFEKVGGGESAMFVVLHGVASVYSNDGNNALLSITTPLETTVLYVTETGCHYSNSLDEGSWVYSGSGVFLGLTTTKDSSDVVYPVGSTVEIEGQSWDAFYIVEGEEESTSTATITYNGNVIATITDGQTATLPCEGKKMVGDIVIAYAVEAVNLISFTIDGTTYQAEEGMTWAEWCDSEYNTSDYDTNDHNLVYGGECAYSVYLDVCQSGSKVIIAGENYTHGEYLSGGGGSND